MTGSVIFAGGLPRLGRLITAAAPALLILFALGACSDDDASTDLEIIGSYEEEFQAGQFIDHEITQTTWTQTSDFGTSIYSIASYSNADDYLIGENDADNAFNPGLFDRFDWTTFDSDLYYCTSAFGQATVDEAITAGDGVADATDPTSSASCGGFTWTRLDPAA